MTTSTYNVAGMTCAHCVASVTQELSAIQGVTSVSVDLETGAVRVESATELPIDAVTEAIDEAGYTLV
jgi:copper ion binding protein